METHRSPHLSSEFEEELTELRSKLLRMASKVEDRIATVIGAQVERDATTAKGVIGRDEEIRRLVQVLSRRTKLTLRLPKHRIDEAQAALHGATLDIGGHAMSIGKAKAKALAKQGTIFCRNLVLAPGEAEDEMHFLQRLVEVLGKRNIHVKKAMPGKTAAIHTPDGPIATRSLMIANLTTDDSVALQQQPLGEHRLLGCGIFLPHKGIEAVKQAGDD